MIFGAALSDRARCLGSIILVGVVVQEATLGLGAFTSLKIGQVGI